MLDCIIWSKDRACQLDLLLRSIKDNFSFLNCINILYKGSTDFFEEGYKKVIDKFPDIIFHKEISFKQDNVHIFNKIKTRFCIAFCDDNVVHNKINIKEFSIALNIMDSNPKILILNLRLQKDMTYNHPQNKHYPLPNFITIEPFLLWDWTVMDPMNEWGYPCACDSYINRTNYYKQYANNLQYNNPNGFEGQMNQHRYYNEPLMMGLNEPKILCIPNNMTQTGYNKHGINPEYTIEVLNEKYLNGFIINTKNIYGVINNAPHYEIPFQLIKE